VGQLLLHYGADSHRIEETVHRTGTYLGADWLDILVSPNAIAITTNSGDEFRTKIRRVVGIGIHLSILDEINRLSRRIRYGELNRFAVRLELERISELGHIYDRWVTVLMVGTACGAFSQLFGGDWRAFLVTSLAAGAAQFVRQALLKQHFHLLIVVMVTSAVATLIASSSALWDLSQTPEAVLAASVLLLVPGVQLVNAAQDMIRGHVLPGITRGLNGLMIVLALSLGLVLALELTGVKL
jgi:uncharacterized membrane protein YjjP (DUF1212 family)